MFCLWPENVLLGTGGLNIVFSCVCVCVFSPFVLLVSPNYSSSPSFALAQLSHVTSPNLVPPQKKGWNFWMSWIFSVKHGPFESAWWALSSEHNLFSYRNENHVLNLGLLLVVDVFSFKNTRVRVNILETVYKITERLCPSLPMMHRSKIFVFGWSGGEYSGRGGIHQDWNDYCRFRARFKPVKCSQLSIHFVCFALLSDESLLDACSCLW